MAKSLRAMGIKPGDRVVGFMPNMPQTIIAMLAATSIGAVWSSCSPDFGIKGVLDRFGQIQPSVIFTADGYSFKGKKIDSLERMAGILKELRTIERVVVVPYTDATPDIRRSPERRALVGFPFQGTRPADRLRAAALRAPALHHVLLRHHGAAEVHGAERGRHPRSPPEGADAAHQPHPQRHHLLLHHLRLDDVELADQLARRGCDAGALRRQPLPPRSRRPVGNGPGGKDHGVRHQRRLHRRPHELRGQAGEGIRPRRRCGRSSPPARRCPWRASSSSTSTSKRTCSWPPSPAARTSTAASPWATPWARSTPESSSAAAWPWTCRPSTRRAGR